MANTNPIFPRVGKINWGAAITTANTAKDGTGTVETIFTADAVSGSRVDTIKVMHLGTNIATVLRIFINNGSATSSATNNSLWLEKTIPAWTLSEVAEQASQIEITADLVLPPGYKLICAIGTTIAAGIKITAIGGDF